MLLMFLCLFPVWLPLLFGEEEDVCVRESGGGGIDPSLLPRGGKNPVDR